MARLHRKFLVLCKEWPINAERPGRADIAKVIHKTVKERFEASNKLDDIELVLLTHMFIYTTIIIILVFLILGLALELSLETELK